MNDNQIWIDIANKLETENCPKGYINSQAAFFNLSEATIYRRLEKHTNWTSGNKKRSDKGSTCQDMEVIKEIAAELKLKVRKNGKETGEVPNIRSVLQFNGREIKISNNRINTLLRENKMDLKTQKKPLPHQVMRSLRPNHVILFDPSLCLIWFLPNGGVKFINDDEAYKNKPETLEKVGKLKVWRYVAVDHYSNVITVKYYESKGENQENLYDFMMYVFSKTDDKVSFGVPDMIYWDKGSANTSAPIKNVLTALAVKILTHKAGNPRAKGSVEEANNRVEKGFESRLLDEPVYNIGGINSSVAAWCHAYNSNCIPHYDSRLKRPLMKKPLARNEIFQTIRSEHVRLLPEDPSVCDYYLESKVVERTVKGDLTISIVHPKVKASVIYDLRDVPGIYPKLVVKVSTLIYGDNQAVVYNEFEGEKIETVVSPVEIADELAGFAQNAAVFGGGYKSHKATVVDKVGQELLDKAFPGMTQKEQEKAIKKHKAPFGGLDAHSHLKDVYTPDYMQKSGSVINVPDRFNLEIEAMEPLEIHEKLLQETGQNYYNHIKKEYPQGIPPEDFELVKAAILNLHNHPSMKIANEE